MSENADKGDFILYDGDCPFCKNYVKFLNLRRALPDVKLLNARDEPVLVSKFLKQGINLNNHMVLRLKGKDFIGADALRIVALNSQEPTVMTRLNKLLFSNKFLGRTLYPFLVAGRKMYLKLVRTPSL
jgi:predicted DCC family thiol-disulfide oxidoreductase YuxK